MLPVIPKMTEKPSMGGYSVRVLIKYCLVQIIRIKCSMIQNVFILTFNQIKKQSAAFFLMNYSLKDAEENNTSLVVVGPRECKAGLIVSTKFTPVIKELKAQSIVLSKFQSEKYTFSF